MAERVEPVWHFFQMFEFLVILAPELVIHLFKALFPVSVPTICEHLHNFCCCCLVCLREKGKGNLFLLLLGKMWQIFHYLPSFPCEEKMRSQMTVYQHQLCSPLSQAGTSARNMIQALGVNERNIVHCKIPSPSSNSQINPTDLTEITMKAS